MRWSKMLIPTMKEVPQEAEIPSHQFMLRAGLIRRLGAGLYTFLPLGLKSLRKVEAIVREEMDRAGALEVLMPAMHPKEIWERTGRYDVLKEVMFSVKDRQNRELVLGPTHEEVITDLVSREINSYRQLPKNFYQIQTKYRDEIRPRFGLMRAKEFIMKDAYSFDTDWDAVHQSYLAMYEAYTRIFKRCGVEARSVEADTGAMGGDTSHEFMVMAEAGEDGVVMCDHCDYAANLERAESRVATPVFDGAEASVEKISTPNLRTIEEVASFLKAKPEQFIKTLIYKVDDGACAVLVPGNREVNEVKLGHIFASGSVELADDALIEQATGAPVGFAGPVGLTIPIYADEKLRSMRGAITGANEQDMHLLHVDLERDASVTKFVDVSSAMEGDQCPRCEGRLVEKRGVEVGHLFKLGTKYAEAMGATYLDDQGQSKTLIMGCYGIGVTRTLQAVIEQCNDQNGIRWPISIAPYEVTVLVLNTKHEESMQIADQLIADLEAQGVEVLFDDREERPGVKFKDADLLGIPIRVTIGERSLKEGVMELKLRSGDDVEKVALDQISSRVAEIRNELVESTMP